MKKNLLGTAMLMGIISTAQAYNPPMVTIPEDNLRHHLDCNFKALDLADNPYDASLRIDKSLSGKFGGFFQLGDYRWVMEAKEMDEDLNSGSLSGELGYGDYDSIDFVRFSFELVDEENEKYAGKAFLIWTSEKHVLISEGSLHCKPYQYPNSIPGDIPPPVVRPLN